MISKSIAVLLLAVSVARAEMRDWRSADGSKSFRGEFIKQAGDSVTIRNESGKEIAFPAAKLHADDQRWLKKLAARDAAEAGVFGGFRFGELQGQVISRLKNNPHVIAPEGKSAFGSPDVLLGVKTRLKPGGSPAEVSFTWAGSGNITKLQGIDITCAPLAAGDYNGKLRKSLDELTELLVFIHGKPGTTASIPFKDAVKQNVISPTSSWTFADDSSLEVGLALNQQGEYLAVARYNAPAALFPPPPAQQ